MFENKDVAAKYKLVGNPIQHVSGLGAVDFSKINLKDADYYYAQKVKALSLINDSNSKADAPVAEKATTKK